MDAVDETQTTAEVPAGCLDDSTVLRFVPGQLDDTARRMVEHEIGQCRRCSALVAELIRGGAAARGGGGSRSVFFAGSSSSL